MKINSTLKTICLLFLLVSVVAAQAGASYVVTQSVIADGGGQNASGGTFSLDGTIGQAVAGNELSGGSIAVTSGFWNSTSNAPAALTYEADVSPRSNSDGIIDSDDVQQIRRFSVGLDLPYQSNEYQRADNSPVSTAGNGAVDADDIQQVRRYSVGLDGGKQASNGPLSGSAVLFEGWKQQTEFIRNSPTATNIRVSSQTATSSRAGQPVVVVNVPILVDAEGNEAGFSFSLTYDATRLTNPRVLLGPRGGNVTTNRTASNPNPNPLGVSLNSFPGDPNDPSNINTQVFPAGAGQVLVTVRFDVVVGAPAGVAAITFGDTPTPRRVSPADPNNPPPGFAQPTYTNGMVTITAPTAATTTVSGRVTTETGRGIRNISVTMTDAQGNKRETRTTSFGYYQFADVQAGQTYIFSVRGKTYGFSQNSIIQTIIDDTNNIDFVGTERVLTP